MTMIPTVITSYRGGVRMLDWKAGGLEDSRIRERAKFEKFGLNFAEISQSQVTPRTAQ